MWHTAPMQILWAWLSDNWFSVANNYIEYLIQFSLRDCMFCCMNGLLSLLAFWAHLSYKGIQMPSTEYGFCWKLNATTFRINPPLPGFLSLALRKITHTLPEHRKKKSDQSDKGFIFLLQVGSVEGLPNGYLVGTASKMEHFCLYSFFFYSLFFLPVSFSFFISYAHPLPNIQSVSIYSFLLFLILIFHASSVFVVY